MTTFKIGMVNVPEIFIFPNIQHINNINKVYRFKSLNCSPMASELISSSVDFCEPNFFATAAVAELHNSWSSLFMTLLGVFGIMWGNQTHEWKIFSMYFTLAVVGLGSVALHTSLHWLAQSADEVPMLWVNLTILYNLICIHRIQTQGDYQSSTLAIVISILGVVQTCMYYGMQNMYWVFLLTFGSVTGGVVIWTLLHVMDKNISTEVRKMRWNMWIRSVISFAAGFALWLLDMNMCDSLLPYYIASPFGGATFHVFWHLGAAYGAFLLISFVSMVYYQSLGYEVSYDGTIFAKPLVKKCHASTPDITSLLKMETETYQKL